MQSVYINIKLNAKKNTYWEHWHWTVKCVKTSFQCYKTYRAKRPRICEAVYHVVISQLQICTETKHLQQKNYNIQASPITYLKKKKTLLKIKILTIILTFWTWKNILQTNYICQACWEMDKGGCSNITNSNSNPMALNSQPHTTPSQTDNSNLLINIVTAAWSGQLTL